MNTWGRQHQSSQVSSFERPGPLHSPWKRLSAIALVTRGSSSTNYVSSFVPQLLRAANVRYASQKNQFRIKFGGWKLGKALTYTRREEYQDDFDVAPLSLKSYSSEQD